MAFGYLKLIGFTRHAGHLYLLWLCCLWLDYAEQRCSRFKQRCVVALWGLHTVIGLSALTLDFGHPFSQTRAAAEYLREHSLDRLPIAALPEDMMSPLCAYLRRPLYYVDTRRSGSFVIWDRRRSVGSSKELLAQVLSQGNPVIFVSNRSFRLERVPGIQFETLARFEGAIVPSECYYVYRLTVSAVDTPR